MITGVTLKTTKREEKMAFFTVEDASGVLECLAFPQSYRAYAEIIKADNAVFVEGNLSVREDEAPKVLVSLMGLLVDNAHFSAESQPAPKGGAQSASARSAEALRPRAEGKPYNPYEAMTPSRTYNPYEAMPAAATPPRQASAEPAPRPTPAAPTVPPQKLYLRVPDREGEPYRKALNLAEIFCDGTTAVIFYDMSDGKYYASNLRMKATPFVLTRLEGILGKENVVAK